MEFPSRRAEYNFNYVLCRKSIIIGKTSKRKYKKLVTFQRVPKHSDMGLEVMKLLMENLKSIGGAMQRNDKKVT